MKLSAAGLALIQGFEELRLEAYLDEGGVWTCGYGATRDISKGSTCTRAMALAWLVRDTLGAAGCVEGAIKVPLNQNQFDALTSFTFNVGCTALRTSTLRKLLNRGDVSGASVEFLKWDHVDAAVSNGLLSRRQQERSLFDRPVS